MNKISWGLNIILFLLTIFIVSQRLDNKINSQQLIINHLLDVVISLQENQLIENNYILNWVQEQRAVYDSCGR